MRSTPLAPDSTPWRRPLLIRRHTLPMTVFLVSLALAGVFGAADAAEAQADICDPGLESDSDSPLAYKMRGSRCEGEYVVQVNDSPDLHLVSLVEHFEDFDPEGDDLVVEWGSLPSGVGDLHLRVLTWKEGAFYRMDALVEPGAERYLWTTDLLSTFGYRRDDLGAIAWASLPNITSDSAAPPVYIPLSLRQDEPAQHQSRYTVLLLPSRRLEEVYVTLEPLGPDGRPGPPLRDQEPLGYGYYPAGSITDFDTPQLDAAGIYRLTLGARLRDGRPATKVIHFYHSTP